MPDTMLAPSLHFKMRLLQLDGPQTNGSAIVGGGDHTHGQWLAQVTQIDS